MDELERKRIHRLGRAWCAECRETYTTDSPVHAAIHELRDLGLIRPTGQVRPGPDGWPQTVWARVGPGSKDN